MADATALPASITEHLHAELGRLIAQLADEHDTTRRTDIADRAYDVLAVLERREVPGLRHPRGLRLLQGGRTA